MAKKPRFCPDRGDIVSLEFSPASGAEQSGMRPALVLSAREYNAKSGLAICCPITRSIRNHPLEVGLERQKTTGVVLVHHVRSIDWSARKAKFIEPAKGATLDAVVHLLTLITGSR